MLSALLALAASLTYGVADYLGGLATRRTGVLAVVTLSQGVGLVLLCAAAPVAGGVVGRGDLLWGAAAGLAGGLAVTLFYRALAMGRMSIVAPVTAVCGLAVPVIVGLALGERPGRLALGGVFLAAASVALLGPGAEPAAPAPDVHAGGGAQPGLRAEPGRAFVTAIAAGVIIGAFYVTLERTSAAAGLWPLLVARVVSVSVFLATAAVLHARGGRPLAIPRAALSTVIGAGVLDVLANALYVYAVRGGLLSIVAPLASLYPASTVLLARARDGERLSRLQT
ncbi:MAG TPA: EamA family transporter, partial [Gemmatimonadaceae bacterium]|nr:EamA family transporter [Gemmatimonadaceae bacterium]